MSSGTLLPSNTSPPHVVASTGGPQLSPPTPEPAPAVPPAPPRSSSTRNPPAPKPAAPALSPGFTSIGTSSAHAHASEQPRPRAKEVIQRCFEFMSSYLAAAQQSTASFPAKCRAGRPCVLP